MEDDGFCYGYDANGNLISNTAKVSGTCSGALTTYSWDVLNRLVRIDFPGGGFAAYLYDADGRRIEKDVDGTITRYVYDNDNIVLEYDGTNALAARYSHGEAVDQPLVMERGGQSAFYHTDFLGSVRKLTNAAGAVLNTYDYDAYGNLEVRGETVVNPYTYTAREFDAESGLHFYRARYYDPATGRFLSEDPIGLESGDANPYRYVFNTPTILVDPDGRSPLASAARLLPLILRDALIDIFVNTVVFQQELMVCTGVSAATGATAGVAFGRFVGKGLTSPLGKVSASLIAVETAAKIILLGFAACQAIDRIFPAPPPLPLPPLPLPPLSPTLPKGDFPPPGPTRPA